MTTEIAISEADDLYEDNHLLRLPRVSVSAPELAGIRFEGRAGMNDSREELRRRCFDVAVQRLLGVWPDLVLWLCLCHSAWQPKTRISLQRRLWKSKEAAKYMLPSGERTGETLVETADGIRYFGAVRIPVAETARAYQLLEAEPESFLISTLRPHRVAVEEPLLSVWRQHRGSELASWSALAGVVCHRYDGLLFRPFGFFDDVEAGVDVFLDTKLLQRWRARISLKQ